jgi:3-hydroxyacyl-CoA dehydrogenase
MRVVLSALCRIKPPDGFRHHGRAVAALEVHGAVKDQMDTSVLEFFRRFEGLAQADTGVHLHHGGEPHLVQAVVDRVVEMVDIAQIGSHAGDQREDQKAMGDGFAVGHLPARAFGVHVQPLVITGGLGEFVDLVLRDGVPVTDHDLLADQVEKRIGVGIFRQETAPFDRADRAAHHVGHRCAGKGEPVNRFRDRGMKMSDLVGYETEGRVAILPIDNPPVNALGIGVREGLMQQLDRAAADDGVDAIVIIGLGRTFPAGADIREFDQPTREPHLIAVVDHIDTIEKPVVAAIHGTALGGGLELALGCHFRVAVPGARMGTPEVNLGIFPGAAGTQRLPRVAGLDHALELIVLGKPVGAAKARDYGIVDAIIEGDLRDGAVTFAAIIVADGTPRRISSEPRDGIGSPDDHAGTIAKYRDLANRRARGQDSPHQAIDSVIDGMTMPYPDAVQADRKRFEVCKNSDQSRALRYAFFAEREASKIPDIGKNVRPREIASTGVIGAGTMGRGIVASLADSGLPVTVVETSQDALDKGMAEIGKLYDGMVRRGRIDEVEKDKRLARISGAVGFDALGEADLVIEAAFEDLDVKKQIFADLDGVAKPGAVLATNTSYMDIDAIAAATARPQDVIGLHYFVPANAMRLLEIVRPAKAAPDAIATGMALAKATGKVGVLARVCHGFIANRSRLPLVREATFLVEEGASPAQIDAVLTGLGMPMGPLAVSDLSGLDVSWRMRRSLVDERDPEARYMHLADRMCELGYFGIKAGKGWYRYEDGGRQPVPDPETEAIAIEVAKELGIERRVISDDEIRERCLYAAINEGAKILDEGVAARASDIDVMWLYGFGYPRWRGGIMFTADEIGLGKIHDRVKAFHAEHGKLWAPSPLLARLAAEGGFFTRAS